MTNPPSPSRTHRRIQSRRRLAISSLLLATVAAVASQSPPGLELVPSSAETPPARASAERDGTSVSRLAGHLASPPRNLSDLDAARAALDSDDLRGRIASDARAYLAGATAESPATLGIRTRVAARFTEPAKAELSRNTGVRSASGAPAQDPAACRGQDPALLFPTTPADSDRLDIASRATREASASIPPENFLDLGRFASGGQWDFFILAQGAARGSTAYTGRSSLNGDVVDHVVSHAFGLKDSPYLLLGYEDLYGNGDDNLDDLLFAIDLANINIAALTATPEPSTYVILGTLLAFGALLKRRAEARAAAIATLPR